MATLIAYDSDAYVRWDAAQRMAQGVILEQCRRHANGMEMRVDSSLLMAFQGILSDHQADPALLAEAMILPDEDYLAEQMEVVDVDGIHAARKFIKKGLANDLAALFTERYAELNDRLPYQNRPGPWHVELSKTSACPICLKRLQASLRPSLNLNPVTT